MAQTPTLDSVPDLALVPPAAGGSASPAVLLQRFLGGHLTDPQVGAWLAHGVAAWWRAGGDVPLTTCLRLPATSAGCARVARDAWLRAAAHCLPARSRALSLAKEIDRFRKAPEDSLVHEYLAFAAACGVPLPGTARQVRNILSETPPGFDFQSLQTAASDFLIHPNASCGTKLTVVGSGRHVIN